MAARNGRCVDDTAQWLSTLSAQRLFTLVECLSAALAWLRAMSADQRRFHLCLSAEVSVR